VPTGSSVAANRLVSARLPVPPRHSRGRRTLLLGAAATGIWLLCGLGHSASAHADAVSPHPAAPPGSTVGNQLTTLLAGRPPAVRSDRSGLPTPGRLLPRSAAAGHHAVLSLPRPSSTVQRLSSTVQRLSTASLPASLPSITGLPVLPIQPVQLPGPVRLPQPVQLPSPVRVPQPIVVLPLQPVVASPLRPGTAQADWQRADWLESNAQPFRTQHPALRQPAAQPAGPPPAPRPVPGSPNAVAPAGAVSGAPTRDGHNLAVLPAGNSAGRALRPAARRGGPATGPRDRACLPDVSPD